MEFKRAQEVWECVQYMLDADKPRSQNRALINRLYNGEAPYPAQTAQLDNIDTNVNFMDAPASAQEARRQYYNGFLRGETYFNVLLDGAPPDKSAAWSRYIAANINRCMKKSASYRETLKGQFAQTVLHGIGPVFWPDGQSWEPIGVGLDDFMIPSRTRTSFANLSQVAILRRITAAELWRMTHGERVDKGWQMKEVNRVLAFLAKEKIGTQPLDWDITPEKLASLYQENLGWWNSDIAPNVLIYDFFYRDPERENRWYRCMIMASMRDGQNEISFLYKKDEAVSDTWEHLIHVQYGNGANTAPFLYHAVRGMGLLTYDIFQLDNRLRSRWSDHVFQQMIQLFKVSSPADQDRLQKVDLVNWGTIPEGLGFVTAAERFSVNPQVIEQYFGQNQRSIAKNTSAWTQDLAHSKDTPMTAFEAAARIQSSNAMISSMLADAYEYADAQYREICRRFTIKNSRDPQVRKFQEYCKRDQVPEEWIDSERWIVRADRVIGDGNKTLEMAQTQALMMALQFFNPEAQRHIIRWFAQAHSDPKKAELLVPEQPKIPDVVVEAQQDAAVLMQNMPLAFRADINHVDYIEAMLQSMAAVVEQVETMQGSMASPQQVKGLMNMGQHVAAHIQIIGQNKTNKSRVKMYGDALGEIENMVKAYAQRLQEQAQSQQPQLSPEAQAKIVEAGIVAQSKAKIDEARAAQKMQLKENAFMSELRHRNTKAALDLRDQVLKTQADIAALDAQTAAQIQRDAFAPAKAQ